MKDWPFEVHPTGWYQVDWSANLGPGEIKPLKYFSEDLILYRGESGRAQVLSAFCPHFGAHLGHGGKVCGDDVQCPWHGWRWDAQGANTHIPYADRPTSRGSLTPWETREIDGIVIVWYDANGDPPSWEWSGVPEFRDEEEFYPIFPYGAERHGSRRIMPQSILENFADTEHFPYVHGAGEPGTHASWQEDGHYLNVKFAMNFGANGPPTWLTPNGPVAGIIESEAFGLGLGIARFIVEGRTVAQLIATTPIDEEHSEMFSTIATNRIPGTAEPEGVAAKWIALQQEQITHDFHIWENQRYVDRPLYAGSEERPFVGVRRFALQFYPRLRREVEVGRRADVAVEVDLEAAAVTP